MVWAAAGFGIAIGAAYFMEAAIALIFIYFALKFLPVLLQKWSETSLKENEMHLKITVHLEASLEQVIAQIEKNVIRVNKKKIKLDGDYQIVLMRCYFKREHRLLSQYSLIREISGVERLEIIEV